MKNTRWQITGRATLKRLLLMTVTVFAISAGRADAAPGFQDDFESGTLADWLWLPGKGFTIDNAMNAIPASGGTCSAHSDSSANRIYRFLDDPLDGPSSFTVWVYDNGLSKRAIAQVFAYSDSGSLQVLGIGKNNNVTMSGEVYDGHYYQGRVLAGTQTGWFNLNAPGAVMRSTGWHEFTIVREPDSTTIAFYVDNVLGRKITGADAAAWYYVALGLGAGSTVEDTWFDGVTVKSAAEQIDDLMILVQSLALSPGTANSLLVKLQAAQAALSRGIVTATCGTLGAFINEVEAQAGKREIAEVEAELLIQEATRIGVVLDCR